jgi:DNA-binding NtrC family response regulator
VSDTVPTEEEPVLRLDERPRVPGLVLLWSAGAPTCRPFDARAGLLLGRSGTPAVADPRLSRKHAEVTSRAGSWRVRDLGTTNGTFVDGRRVADVLFPVREAPRFLRVGTSLFLVDPDLLRFGPLDDARDLRVGDHVVGPATRDVLAVTLEAAEHDRTLLITGESGTGKERVAHAYHQRGPRARGPFVAFNCATLAKDLAESQLFGAERGAHSTAHVATPGLLRQAHGGVLFLDELAELAPEVQAKLLRAVETKAVIPLGATSPRPADVAIVSATNANVRQAATLGSFRHDLLPRLAQREVQLPALRERPEEIPWLVHLALEARPAPPPSVHFVEACLLRAWRLNVRELFMAVEQAAAAARRAGAKEIAAHHLPPELLSTPAGAAPSAPPPASTQPASLQEGRRAELLAALEAHGFDAVATARAIGMPKSSIYAAMKRFGIKAR